MTRTTTSIRTFGVVVFLVCNLLGCGPKVGQTTSEAPGAELGRSTQRLLERVDEKLAAQEWDGALSLLDEAAHEDLNPYERAVLGVKRADAYVNTDRYQLAAESLAQSVGLHALPEAQQLSTTYRLLKIHVVLRRYDAAVALADREALVAKSPVDEGRLQLLCDLYQHERKFGEAASVAERLVDSFPAQKAHRLRLAVSYEELGRSDDALRVLERAHQEGMLSEEVELLALVDLARKQGQAKQAAVWLEQHIREGKIKSSPENQLRLASCWLAAGDAERAQEALGRLDQDAVPGDVFLELGKLYVQRGQWEQARGPLALSLGRNVTSPGEAYLFLGVAHYQRNDASSSLQALSKAEREPRVSTCARQWQVVVRSRRQGQHVPCLAELTRQP
jgi:tetratricopeptide (TPR) repeat protein